MASDAEATSLMPYSVLEAIPKEEGALYTTLLNYQSLLTRYSDVNSLASEIHKIIALALVKTVPEYSDEEGEDYRLFLTDRGKNILKTLHE